MCCVVYNTRYRLTLSNLTLAGRGFCIVGMDIRYFDDDGNALEVPDLLVDPELIEQVLAVPAGPGEQPYHVEACRIWMNGGSPLKQQEVADRIGKSVTTVRNWASRYRWRDRLNAIKLMANMSIAEQAAIDVDHEMRQMLDSVNRAMASYDNAVSNNKVRWRGGDIKGLVETKMLVIGRPTDRHEIVDANPAVDRILNDPDTVKLAAALFVRLGQGDASGPGSTG